MMFAVQTEGLSKQYGDRMAVNKLDLELRSGVVTGFVGHNGAGKTTTIRMLLGLIDPTAGSGQVLGQPLTHPERYLGSVGALIEAPAFYPTLTGRNNLKTFARLGRVPFARIDELIDLVELNGRENEKYGSYSLGMKQRLGLAAALLPDPQLLILDEPGNGLDPAGIREMRSLLRNLADSGKTILVSSHLLGEVEAICDDVVLIADGELRYSGATAGILSGQAHLRVRPQDPDRLIELTDLAAGPGREVTVEDGTVLVATDDPQPGELSRACMDANIVLVELAVTQPSLEEAYFTLTGDSSAAGARH